MRNGIRISEARMTSDIVEYGRYVGRGLEDIEAVLAGDLVFQDTWEPKDDEILPEWEI